MLDDGPLLAPCCCPLPPSIRPAEVLLWSFRLDVPLLYEIYAVPSPSVLYEMATYCLQRPWRRRSPAAGRLEALMQFFADTLRCFDQHALLLECRQLLKNHLEAEVSCVRFHPALEFLLPPDETQPANRHTIRPPNFCGTPESLAGQCTAEEVDPEQWVFRDVADVGTGTSGPSDDPGGVTGKLPNRQLRLGGDAKLAFSVTLFLWAAVRLLVRRIELLMQFPPDHPLFVSSQAPQMPKAYLLGDSLEMLLFRRRQMGQHAAELYRQGDFLGSLDRLTQAIAISPEEDEGLYILFQYRADLHHLLGQPERAVDDCCAALSINPHAFLALYYRAQAYQALGLLESAMADVAEQLRLFPGNARSRELHAALARDLPDHRGPCCVDPETPAHRENGSDPTRPFLAATDLSSPISPLSLVPSSVGSLHFSSPPLSIDLNALPACREPRPADDPPFLASLLEGGAELEYVVCPGKELGRGAFGRVYKAVHPRKGYLMAVKEIEARHLEAETDLLEAFELVWSLKHTNVIRSLGIRRLPGFYHVVLEYCSAGTLRSLADGLCGLPLPLMRKFATDLLLGLRYMHGHGLLHRDVKASNVLLAEDGTAKLADLGTCIRISVADKARKIAVLKGTVLWMAPESFCGCYSMASDMWSFGCVLIEMAIAKDPWHEQQFKEQLTAMVFIATRPDVLPAVPPVLERDDVGIHFFHCCIARDPAERVSPDLLLRHPWLSGSGGGGNPLPSTPSPGTSSQGTLGQEANCEQHCMAVSSLDD